MLSPGGRIDGGGMVVPVLNQGCSSSPAVGGDVGMRDVLAVSSVIGGTVGMREVLAASSDSPSTGLSKRVGAVAIAQSVAIGRPGVVVGASDRAVASLGPERSPPWLGSAGGAMARAAGRPAPLSLMCSGLSRRAAAHPHPARARALIGARKNSRHYPIRITAVRLTTSRFRV